VITNNRIILPFFSFRLNLDSPLTPRTKGNYEQKQNALMGYPQALNRRMLEMVRLARESLAFASVASFVWMVCTVAGLVG